ncbi:O-methyltransferase-domain-containing protein [Aspergillus pseudodeflectus]|uniref:O-methyltransferase-domain-containing protein n=1 Tax=Aspergillus pseudodeflectus TaxID=176178 RepID=A0ABR4K9Z3_9EURO
MEDIVTKLLQDVRALHDYLDTSGLPHPSFDKNTPPVVLPNDAPLEVQNAREQIMDAALRLFRLAAGPSDHISQARTAYEDIATLQWLWHFQIFDLVPAEGSISYPELAGKANVAVAHAKSIIRMAITAGLFEEPTPQQVSHSATSLYIRNSEPNRTWAAWVCDVSVPAAAAMVAAQTKWPRSLSRIHTSYNSANDTELPFFDHLAQLAERKALFQSLMKAVSSLQKHDLKHTIAGFDWASLGEATVVDVGGSTGHVSIALAREFPSLKFIVQDLPEVIDNAPSHLASLSDSTALASRITYLAHSFLTPQPIRGAAVYFLRMILHDWPTDDAINILSHLVPALEKDSRIIVMDSLLPDPGSVPLAKERLFRAQDLTMLQNFNAGERALEDWRQMFARVEGGLAVRAIRQPVGSNMAFIELGLE